MAKVPKNHNQPWTLAAKRQLRQLAAKDTPTGLIAYELGRTEASIYGEASRLRVSLKPVNRSPYNRQPGGARTARRRAK